MFDVSYGAGQWETQFATKHAAITWARDQKLDSFEVIDENDVIVYQEFPPAKFV